MRYDNIIYLVYAKEPSYNPKLGRYEDETTVDDKRHANISKVSLERNRELFGDVDSDVTIIRLQGLVKGNPDYIKIKDKEYNIIKKTTTRRDTAFYIRERV